MGGHLQWISTKYSSLSASPQFSLLKFLTHFLVLTVVNLLSKFPNSILEFCSKSLAGKMEEIQYLLGQISHHRKQLVIIDRSVSKIIWLDKRSKNDSVIDEQLVNIDNKSQIESNLSRSNKLKCSAVYSNKNSQEIHSKSQINSSFSSVYSNKLKLSSVYSNKNCTKSQINSSFPTVYPNKNINCHNGNRTSKLISYLCVISCSLFIIVDGCRIGEIRCSDGTCLSPDKFCDGDYDCPGREDEPRHCTPCGRIYYGSAGETYHLEVHRPVQSRGPQECNLTFVATGDSTGGDIVQLSILKFSLGKFHSHTDNGCPHGHMQIIEYQRLYRPGYWCGNGVGMELYYSETPSVTVLLTMLPPDNDLTALDVYPSFYFLMTYKFLRHYDAIVRYGLNDDKKYTGIRDRTTVCNVHFQSCDSSPCYVQSPNFPGLYPRNTTCYYHLKQPVAVTGTRAVLVLGQKAGFLVHIKSASQPHDVEQRQLRLYDDCYYAGDYVRVYDGNSTTSPVLITFCRGSAVPEIVSSGPNMLIEFTTSAFDEPDHEVPWKYLNGFELVARARYLPIKQIGSTCRTTIDGRKKQSGWISTPNFSVAPNTTCVWEFVGQPNHVLWLTFAHYWIEKQDKLLQMTLCAAELTIYDGLIKDKAAVLGSFCSHKLPRVCERAHILKTGSATRPCGANESYVTSGPNIAISQSYGESTVVKNVKFLLRYEFVNNKLPGEKLADPCDRILKSDGTGKLFSLSAPKNVFLYGRGGRENIRCSWVLEGLPGEKVRLNITSLTLGNSKCRSTTRLYTQALGCRADGSPYMSLDIAEWPWLGVEVPKSCICSSDSVPLTIESRSSLLAINLTITGMGPGHDYRNFSFSAHYEFTKRIECEGGDRRLESPAGELLLGNSEPIECSGRPWLLTAPVGHSLLLTLPRAALANESCASDSRLLLSVPGAANPSLAICPSADPTSNVKLLWPPNSELDFLKKYEDREVKTGDVARLVIQWEARSLSSLTMQWLRLWSPFNGSDFLQMGGLEAAWGPGNYDASKNPMPPQCREWCPELNACIPAELWCDGVPHCPNGSDEAVSNCLLERIPWLYIVTTSVTLFILMLITASALRRRHLQEVKRRDQEARRASTQESFLPPKDNHRLSAFTSDFTDMDFETTV